ncbi:hypothetical protein ACFQL1_10085 [Halomicroarcula sp. GCM10025709]|uniref:hypothetical protein n=1 Tax=Haloarcula TaxID=2237 RepID=UPI0024C38B93|nr:hypothetical protein [Halomicroarcula sp. YJ-61-S]
MNALFDSPAVRYGMGFVSALVLTFVAFVFLSGPLRWVVLALAAFEAVFVPRILAQVG